jgi:hypothetical protein
VTVTDVSATPTNLTPQGHAAWASGLSSESALGTSTTFDADAVGEVRSDWHLLPDALSQGDEVRTLQRCAG